MSNIHEILQQYWGYSSFRPKQEEIIHAVLEGKDTLALLPTGGGKSICFQVPAMAKEGICVVVSPLVALMKDQVEQLRKRGITAYEIHSGLSYRQIDILLNNCIYGKVKFLYVSPERLKTEILQERVKQMNVNLLAIDEAHCISQWGYDFRPAYLEIKEFRELIPNVTCIALTATATKEVKKDIQVQLGFQQENEFRKSFARPNLSYSSFFEENKEPRLLKILQNVQGSAVVYVRSRNRTMQISQFLQQRTMSASFYHAGLPPKERAYRQEMWIAGNIRIMVATNAFGMGIDKPDVRVVVHVDLPDSLEAYYQEAGRAGRDELKAYATVLYNKEDIEKLTQNVEAAFPQVEFLQNVYQRLGNFFNLAVGSGELSTFDFDLERFSKNFQLPMRPTYTAIKKLEEQGFLQLSEGYSRPSTVMMVANAQRLYEFQIANSKVDGLIKVLLREYGGGIFESYLRISEKKLGSQLKMKISEVSQQLTWLHEQQILHYQPASNSPQITFLEGRYPANQLPINYKAYRERKELATQKAEKVIAYVQSKNRCRTLLLLDYFDEQSSEKCGVCDTCLQQKKWAQDHNKEYRLLKEWIENSEGNPFAIDKLVESHPLAIQEGIMKIVRKMLATHELKKLENGMLQVGNR